jgi:hypothetical protein
MTDKEPMKVLVLIESMFPGVDLGAIKSLLKDTELRGTINVKKKVGSEAVDLTIEITA